MFKANELENLSMLMDEPMKELENRIMVDIVRRIKINSEITRSADWQINHLRELGMSKLEIKQAIQDSLKYSDKDMLELYKGILKSGYERDKEIYLKSGLMQVPFEENDSLQKLISAVSEQTDSDMKNITQSLGFAVRQPTGKLRFQPIADYYQKTLDGAIYDIASGAFDYNSVLKRVVSEMTNSGLRTVDYATGWSNRVDVAARRAVMTGMSQLTAKVNEDTAKELGTEYFEVTWHGGARPTHQVWQGKVYSKSQLETVCGLGTVTGLCGANCYHDYFPFIPGVSERTYTDKQLAQMNAEENIKREFGGKQYTKYEALQRQRRLETTMRAQRQQISLLTEGGADEDDIITARGRYRVTSAEYARFSNAMNLPQQRERVTVDGLGNIGVGKWKKAVDKSGESGIMKRVEETNNYDELEKYLSSKYNITTDDSVKQLDFKTVRETLKGIESVFDDFPELGDNIKKIGTDKYGVMCCSGEEIKFNPKYYKDVSKFKKMCENSSAQGWWPPNSSPASIGVHETGHAVEWLLLSKSDFDYPWQKVYAWNRGDMSGGIVSKAVKNIKKISYGKGKKQSELMNAVSGYGATKKQECFAEAFADCFSNGESANPLSREIVKLAKEKYISLKGT